ncbi:GTPase IMAP family member 4-like [Megalops cyprinoides]|uniref:GTPase IMAP family member 4-like n=1 Tax=Megalops cyprinoides TaxID=118141 RepID=UPI0018647AA1|nr:GTPase IMAP family member 4-like [Megalops cyprinoides]
MATAEGIQNFRIVLLGGRWAGKSSTGNTILRRKAFAEGKQTLVCAREEGEVAGRRVSVVDTPSWNWVPAEDTSDEVKDELKRSVTLFDDGGPHALLIVYPMGSPFVKRHRVAVEEHLELIGENVWRHTIVLFSRGDWLGDTTIEEHIEKGGNDLKWLVEKCGNRYHVLNNKSDDITQVTELLEKIEELVKEVHEMRVKRRNSREPPPNMSAEIPAPEVGEPSTGGTPTEAKTDTGDTK